MINRSFGSTTASRSMAVGSSGQQEAQDFTLPTWLLGPLVRELIALGKKLLMARLTSDRLPGTYVELIKDVTGNPVALSITTVEKSAGGLLFSGKNTLLVAVPGKNYFTMRSADGWDGAFNSVTVEFDAKSATMRYWYERTPASFHNGVLGDGKLLWQFGQGFNRPLRYMGVFLDSKERRQLVVEGHQILDARAVAALSGAPAVRLPALRYQAEKLFGIKLRLASLRA